jgi:predicted nucleic acid-binding protein
MDRRIFMDTAFLLAVTDRSDEYHLRAEECYRKLIKDM